MFLRFFIKSPHKPKMHSVTATYFNLLKVYLFETWPAFIQLAILYLLKILSAQYVTKEYREEHTCIACRCFRIACQTLFISCPGHICLNRWGKQEVWAETLSLVHSCIERAYSQTEDQSKVLLGYCFTTSLDQSETQQCQIWSSNHVFSSLPSR